MNFLVVIIFIYLVGGIVTVPLPYTSFTAHNFCSAKSFIFKFFNLLIYEPREGYLLCIPQMSQRLWIVILEFEHTSVEVLNILHMAPACSFNVPCQTELEDYVLLT